MKFFILLSILLNFLFSCRGKDNRSNFTENKGKTKDANNYRNSSNQFYKVDTSEIIKDWSTWYTYTYYNIRLAQSFIGLDVDSSRVDKSIFLHKLLTGNFISLKITDEENNPVYKLYKLKNLTIDIQTTIKQMAQTAITLSEFEGRELPEYHFIDLNGKIYDKKNTKGKLLVIKCWFINCIACVKEFPTLNKLVDRYKERNDVEFISLASDSKQDLIPFLKKKNFEYAVIPESNDYMSNKLVVNAYPMHLLINKKGKIVKVTNSIDDLIPSIEKEIH